jgi:hypothetical protein
MEENKCNECNTDLKKMKTPKGWMKCLNQDCSLCYVLTEDSTFDIGRWQIRGKSKV